MKKLLLTGSEPFLSFTVNPTMRIIEELNDQQIGSYEIHSEVLSVDFTSSGKQLLEHIERVQPDAALSFGLAGGRYKMTSERIAINVKDGEADNSGNKPIDSRFIAHFAFERKIFVGEILHKIHSCTTLIDHRVGLQLAGL